MAWGDPVVTVAVGLASAAGTGLIVSRREHSHWTRERRLEACAEFIDAAVGLAEAMSQWHYWGLDIEEARHRYNHEARRLDTAKSKLLLVGSNATCDIADDIADYVFGDLFK